MKKVGIITFHSAPNYGAVLQAYATYKVVESLGCRPIVINRQATTIYGGKVQAVLKCFTVLLLPSKICAKQPNLHKLKIFSNFRKKYLTNTTRYFFSSKSLANAKLQLDYAITGSDQVWNYQLGDGHSPGMGYNFFLDFVPAKTKRIAYAASFGSSEWNQISNVTAKIHGLINEFSAISVRESDGKIICKNVFNCDAQTVLDPTLLVNPQIFYDLIQDIDVPVKSDILFFKLGKDDKFCDFSEKLAKKYRFSFCEINPQYNTIQYNTIHNPTVNEWIKLISKAKLIITDSFHAMVFSIIFRRPFVVLTSHIPSNMNRQKDLMSRLDITNRYITYEELINNLDKYLVMDYSVCENRIEKEKQNSLRFLKKALDL